MTPRCNFLAHSPCLSADESVKGLSEETFATRSATLKVSRTYSYTNRPPTYSTIAAKLDHAPGCLHGPDETVAEKRARGELFVPEHLIKDGMALRRAGFSTTLVNKALRSKAKEENLDMTWNWHHFNHKLESVLGKIAWDARVLCQWLSEREHMLNLTARYEQNSEGCLDKVFFLEEGAKEHWAKGNHVLFYDTTHCTNNNDMKLGCFCAMDNNGKTKLIAVSLIRHEDARSFLWAFNLLIEALGSKPSIMFTDGDHAMAAVLKMHPEIVHLLCIFHMGEK